MPEITVNTTSDIGRAINWTTGMMVKGLEGGPVAVEVRRVIRTDDQNDKFHPMIRDIIKGIDDHPAKAIMGKNEDQWRYYLVANFMGQLMVPSMDGQQLIVVAKKGTSKLLKPEASDFIEYLYSIGTEYGIAWSEPSLAVFAEYKENQK